SVSNKAPLFSTLSCQPASTTMVLLASVSNSGPVAVKPAASCSRCQTATGCGLPFTCMLTCPNGAPLCAGNVMAGKPVCPCASSSCTASSQTVRPLCTKPNNCRCCAANSSSMSPGPA